MAKGDRLVFFCGFVLVRYELSTSPPVSQIYPMRSVRQDQRNNTNDFRKRNWRNKMTCVPGKLGLDGISLVHEC